MRLIWVVAILFSTSLIAQPARRPMTRGESQAISAEHIVKQALEQMGNEKKAFERDIAVVRHLKAADAALRDPMQPAVAVQKAFEHVREAERLAPPVPREISLGVLRVRQELEAARRSPGSADFGRLRSFLNEEAIGPASRALVRRATRLQEETIAWLKLQESISELLRSLTEIVGGSLREAE
jgi:hypothetical protein